MDEDLELCLLAGLDSICEYHDINPIAVLRLMLEEGLVTMEELYVTELHANADE